MKIFTLSLVAIAGLAAFNAQSAPQIVEVPLKGVYLPRVGFDDNDAVEIVLDGELPNLCYTLTEAKATVDADTKKIKVVQYASRRTDGMCAESAAATLPEEALVTNPFQATLNIGQLASGQYAVSFASEAGERVRKFNVGMAPVASVDNVRYAMVSGANVADVVSSTQPTMLELKGLLPTPCHRLGGVSVEAIDDVVIVLPVIQVVSSGPCLQVIRPFTSPVNLGVLSAGRHLVHVRSANGRSVNRLLTSEAPAR